MLLNPAALPPLSSADVAGRSGRGWGARLYLVVGLLYLFFSKENKATSRSRSIFVLDPALLPRVPVEGSDVDGQFMDGDGSYADETSPDPWRRAVSTTAKYILMIVSKYTFEMLVCVNTYLYRSR